MESQFQANRSTMPRIGFLGPLHTFSHAAAATVFGTAADWVPLPSIWSVFDEVIARQCDYGVVPLENSCEGGITETLVNFARARVLIRAEVRIPIHLCLMARSGESAIRRVLSKRQAFAQCRVWLGEHLPQAELVEVSSTADAASRAAEDPSIAAIASHSAAGQFELSVLFENVEDGPDNSTRFVVIGLDPTTRSDSDKTAILVQLPDTNGTIVDLPMYCSQFGLRLLWMQSFSTRFDQSEESLYFLEVVGHHEDVSLQQGLAALAPILQRLSVLGSYRIA